MRSLHSGRGYRYLPAVEQYSAGVCADESHELRRVQLDALLPLEVGFEQIAAALARRDLPMSALCAVELRSPTAMSEPEFEAFNLGYRAELGRRGLLIGDDNPIARTNVCPLDDAPPIASVHAFTYVVSRKQRTEASFVVSGSAEAPEGTTSYADSAVAFGDTTEQGLCAKAEWVLGEIESRMAALGQDWSRCSQANVHTRYGGSQVDNLIASRVGAGPSTTWWRTTPPVVGLDFEMDCRSTAHEVLTQETA